jgi:hypothetical protein
MNLCRSCGAEIQWVKLESGKTMPVDAYPAKNGNILVKPGGMGAVMTKEELEVVRPRTPLHLSHFSTCPNAAQHRKRSH